MRDDLDGLEISHKELRQLTNLPIDNELKLITNPLKNFLRLVGEKIRGTEGTTVAFMGLSSLIFAYLLFDLSIKLFANWVTTPSWFLLILICLWLCGVIQLGLYFVWNRRNSSLKANITNSLQVLLHDVERYNNVIKVIDINDQIEAAGNAEVRIKERNKVTEALKLTRNDLIRALKTEKILRENKHFMLRNSELFTNNLVALASIQVTQEATEHSKLLNEALEIALDVQYQMKKLQGQS